VKSGAVRLGVAWGNYHDAVWYSMAELSVVKLSTVGHGVIIISDAVWCGSVRSGKVRRGSVWQGYNSETHTDRASCGAATEDEHEI